MSEEKRMVAENLIKEKLNIKEIDNNATLDTYGLDSLDVMEFLLDIEDKLNIKFENEEFKDLKTVGELIKLIDEKIK